MKYVLAITDACNDVYIEYFDTKDALLAFFDEPFFNSYWTLIDTVDWNHLENYDAAEPEYIARATDNDLYKWAEAHLRVIK